MTIFKEKQINKSLPSLLGNMQKIAQSVIINAKFLSDFEINDRLTLERCKEPSLFAWYVYDYGTHLFPLNDMNQVAEFQKEWLQGQSVFENKKQSNDDRLYVLNVFTGDLKRVFEFKREKNLVDHLQKAAG
ncbi:hypothetical protein BK120_33935 [Paenibacillus sp. FSL A5-0031]|uniref:hypothetical protein n=1 Tax=Paenibacillus sp. FSL A5-0031 TaxID=1920420 RepID=UPI00096C9C23|nr:hypothetical protein [Paenibacillus sp. FSL A5-0031]OME69184.1 hypothetical protein BK120_33935 [Paenibacillus sp. FSL A5-0031]